MRRGTEQLERPPEQRVGGVQSDADGSGTPKSAPARAIELLIRGYQLSVSPLLPSACRYYPTCSQYALEAVRKHGAQKGGWLAIRRILRCHPFHAGGYDPVP